MFYIILALFLLNCFEKHFSIAQSSNGLENVLPSFVRSAVESYPNAEIKEASGFSNAIGYDEIFLPLRSAVESVPSINEVTAAALIENTSNKAFIRDAVETIPIEEDKDDTNYIENSVESSKIGVKSLLPFQTDSKLTNRYAAYILPPRLNEDVDTFQPQPYRSDSPYQQLLQADEISKLTKTDNLTIMFGNLHFGNFNLNTSETNRNVDTSPDENIYLNGRPYGALALTKYSPPKEVYNNSAEVLCYITNWSFHRQGNGQFVPEYIDKRLCTKLIYSFASLDPDLLNIREFDPVVDIDNKLYHRAVSTGIPVLIALGGWTDSSGDKYSRLVASDIKRRVFASNIVGFIRRHGFAGLHFDWNYPKCWQSDCSRGPASDKPNLTKLLREVRNEFRRANDKLKLGIAISGYKEIITEAYELAELSKIVDYLTVMSYDYHGAWEGQTGHVSPLYGSKGDRYPQYNTDFTMKLLIKLGARKERIIMSIPFYGQSFTLAKEIHRLVGEGIKSIGPGEPGEYTKQPGMLAYYEICQRVRKHKWLKGRDAEGKSGPFAMFGNQWVGFEDSVSIEAKVRYAINAGFGGIAAWTIDLDDYENRCCREPYPLLSTINRVLGRLKTSPPTSYNCARPSAPITPSPPIMTTTTNDGSIHNHITFNPTSTTQSYNMWWSPSTTTTTTTTPYTNSTTNLPVYTERPINSVQEMGPTTIPAPSLVRPMIQSQNCVPGHFYADPLNCNAYYHCIVAGELHQQHCPGGLHWNVHNRNCDWPAAAKCTPTEKPVNKPISDFTISTSAKPARPIAQQTTQKPIATYPINSSPPSNSNCNDGEYYSHRKCSKYYICVNGFLIPSSCGSHLHWDGVRKICDWPENVKCITTTRYLRLVQSKTNPDDPCNGEERIPYPNDCSKYLFCLWNRFQAGDCAAGLHFNAALGVCDWPQNAQCQEIETGEDTNQLENKPFKPTSATTTAHPLFSTTTKPPPSTTSKPQMQSFNGYYKIVCYFTNWAWYRQGVGRYTPDNINTNLCTHIVYGFAVLDSSELIIRTHDSWADLDNNFYTRVTSFRNKGIKISLALGGWNDSQGDKYSRLVRSSSARSKFIQHAVDFLERYGFQGLDLDWEYPVCWQTDCNKGMLEEKASFTAFVRELSKVFKPRGLLLSAAVSPSKKIIDAGYDVAALASYMDWIAVMTYDFHGQWDKKTGHVAPLYYHPDDEIDYFNANYSLNYWILKGAPSRKLVMGMPLYGQSFTLENAHNNGLNAKAPSAGQAGEYTRAAGFLAYYEICDRVNNRGWQIVQDEKGRMGPFARKDSQWVSYDDAAMIRRKSQLVRALNLGGAMVWALDLDDFQNYCGEGEYPLLSQIRHTLKDPPKDHEPFPAIISAASEPTENDSSEIPCTNELEAHNLDSAEVVENILSISEEESDNNLGSNPNDVEISPPWFQSDSQDFKVVCYFTNWAWYRQGGGKFLPEDIDGDLCTHIVYGFAVLNRESLTIQPHDSWADLDNNFYKRVTFYRSKGKRVSIAIGGWNDSAGDKYARLVKNANARARFIRHAVQFLETYGFDGLDLDWEYPVCWQVDCSRGSPEEKFGFVELIRELSQAFQNKGFLLSAAVSPNQKVIDAGYDVPQLSKYLDWISVMAYDYHGQWDKKTGHVAPMYSHPAGSNTFNANFSINYWIEKGANPKKIVMGMPLYGQSFSLADADHHGLNALAYGGGEAGIATRARGFLSYYEICSNLRKRHWNVVRDSKGRMGPYAYLRDQWVSFDDIYMIYHKAEYVKAMKLGGAMIWALDLDDFKNVCNCESYPLLKAINRVLRNYPGAQPDCILEDSDRTMISQYDDLVEFSRNPLSTINHNPQPTVESSENDEAMDCNGRNYSPHLTDCNKYYICQHGKLIGQKCPYGLHWNSDYCDWPQNSKCITSNVYTTNRPTVMRPLGSTIAPNTKPLKQPTNSPVTLPKPISDPILSKPFLGGNCNFKIVCYFTNWAWYRSGDGKYLPEDIDENLCTHIVYGFTVLDANSLTIKTHDPWADIDNKFYERVLVYKKKGIRVSVAIGGWNDSLGSKYARMVLNSDARRNFIKSVLAFIDKYGFDGIDLDWEYPVCWQVDCSKGSPKEKTAFADLVRELSAALKPRSLLLSAAVSPSKVVVDAGYDVPILARYFDWIAVMAYDFHGNWDRKTGHVAPLYQLESDTNPNFNANFSIRYWIKKGVSPEKLVMGMPLYGQSFTLADQKEHGLNAKSLGAGRAGTYTRSAGFLAYYEICESVSNGGWTVVRDSKHRIGPYAYSGNQWVSYDDVSEIRYKANYIKELGLGGGMVWALDLDDFRGRCGCGKYPLLRTLNQQLRCIPGQKANDCT